MESLMTLFGRAAGVRGGRFDREALAATLARWWRRYLTRRMLRELDPRLLRDVGLTLEQRERECRKWFFR